MEIANLTFTFLTESDFPWGLLLLADPSRQQIEKYIRNSVVIGLCDDSTVIGVSVIKEQNPLSAEIMNIAVDEKYQGQGLGKLLLSHSLKECADRGFKIVEIGTGNSSLSQLGLYQKIGFRITGVIEDYFVENYPEPIVENGIVCRDMIRLRYSL